MKRVAGRTITDLVHDPVMDEVMGQRHVVCVDQRVMLDTLAGAAVNQRKRLLGGLAFHEVDRFAGMLRQNLNDDQFHLK